MSFEWRTDEDERWPDDAETTETAVPEQSFLQRRWRFLLITLLGLLAVWALVQWQINQRVAEATDTIQAEILAAHNFVLQTAVSQDESLFRANLSGRNPDWTELQKTLFAEELLLGRPKLGWQHQADVERLAPDLVEFVVDSDLQGAVLLYPQAYVVQQGAALTETVVLQQTAVYRQGTSRWLYAPPDEDFWGDWITYSGDYLTLVYPERDREISVQLAVQLDRLLAQMCTELADLDCDQDFQIHLRLDTDPQSLLRLNDIKSMLQAGTQFELPAPTLIGLPTDDVSQKVLYEAYGVQVATAVLAHQIDYECCAHQLFFRALRDYQLDQLGLQPWPLTPAMYQQVLGSGFDGDVARHWTRRWEEAPPQFLQVWHIEEPDPIWQQVYMLVEFLAAEETAASPTYMMRQMNRNSYDSWLANLVPSHTRSTVEARFLVYIHNQIMIEQPSEPPIPLPDENITLICSTYGNGSSTHVYTYNLTRKTWTERFRNVFDNEGSNVNISTVDGEHFIVSENRYENDMLHWQFYLATEDAVVLLEEAEFVAENEHWLYYFWTDISAEFLIRQEFVEGEGDIQLLPTACADGSCPSVPLNGYPVFSPDRAHLLVEESSGALINVSPDVPYPLLQDLFLMTPDGTLRQHLGNGAEPFWLSETVYGFARMADDEWELVTAVLDQNQPRTLLTPK